MGETEDDETGWLSAFFGLDYNLRMVSQKLKK
jgi:hypothetical protein